MEGIPPEDQEEEYNSCPDCQEERGRGEVQSPRKVDGKTQVHNPSANLGTPENSSADPG